MSENSLKTHPLIVIAATTLILTCLLAIGVMTGIVPSPLNRDGAPAADIGKAPAPPQPAASASRESRLASKAPRTATQRAPVGSTASTAPSQTVAGAAACTDCGTVTSVRAVTQQGEAGLLGPAAGGLVGGVVGSQIGSGSGKTLATIAGAAGGAAIGTEVERRSKTTTHYVVGVRMNDGTTRSFNYQSAPAFQTGERVRVVEGRLERG